MSFIVNLFYFSFLSTSKHIKFLIQLRYRCGVQNLFWKTTEHFFFSFFSAMMFCFLFFFWSNRLIVECLIERLLSHRGLCGALLKVPEHNVAFSQRDHTLAVAHRLPQDAAKKKTTELWSTHTLSWPSISTLCCNTSNLQDFLFTHTHPHIYKKSRQLVWQCNRVRFIAE